MNCSRNFTYVSWITIKTWLHDYLSSHRLAIDLKIIQRFCWKLLDWLVLSLMIFFSSTVWDVTSLVQNRWFLCESHKNQMRWIFEWNLKSLFFTYFIFYCGFSSNYSSIERVTYYLNNVFKRKKREMNDFLTY